MMRLPPTTIAQHPHLSTSPLDPFDPSTDQSSIRSNPNPTSSDCSEATITMDTMMTDSDTPVFHLFSKLPIEIRRKIWALNLPGPRLIEVIERNGNFYGCAYPVINLAVCRESRNEGLKTHPLSFSVEDAPPLIAFNFEIDTLLLGRKLQDEDNHIWFRRKCDERELASVQFLMVDADLCWKVRKKGDRGSRLCGLSWLVFSGVKDYTALYTKDTDPLPFWAKIDWFPRLGPWHWRVNERNPQQLVEWLQDHWHCSRGDRILIRKVDRERYRFGGFAEYEKFDPAIKRWSIPKVYSLGVEREVIVDFNWSEVSCWAELMMDRAIDDIFD